MLRRAAVALFIICVSLFSIFGGASAYGATPKVGGTCTKIGAKSGSLICSKVNGKLKWQIVKKRQLISFTAPSQTTVNEKSVNFVYSSTSKLVVKAATLTPEICSIGKGAILLTGAQGRCEITLSQAGNASFLPSVAIGVEVLVFGINEIEFQLPGALLLAQGSYELSATSSSGLPVQFFTTTADFCTINGRTLSLLKIGNCTVIATQAGGDLFDAATPVSLTVQISGSRVMADLPDTFTGFQIKAVYVVPSDAVDNSSDTDGTIARILDDGIAYLKSQLNLTIPIDSTNSGYDITFLKSSQPSSYFLGTSGTYAELLDESKLLDSPGSNRKDYIFFVQTDTVISPSYCGEAPTPGISAVVAIGVNECGKATSFFSNYASQTWVHELFHNFGVSHVPDACDLMTSGLSSDGALCPATRRVTIDANRNLYFGATAFGSDISKLRVWSGFTNDRTLVADCTVSNPNAKPLADGLKYAYCPTGTQTIGPVEFCWSFITTDSLEELVNGAWVSLGSAGSAFQPWGVRVDWKCGSPAFTAPTIQITVESAGVRHYRWVINGEVKEEFKIIWVN